MRSAGCRARPVSLGPSRVGNARSARCSGSCSSSDQIGLSADRVGRAVRHDLRIVSRVNQASWLSRIKHAGADVAQSPYDSYGASLAASALSSAVLDLHDLPLLGLGTEEIIVDASSSLVGIAIPQLMGEHKGVYVLGLRRDQQLHNWHEISDAVRAGDILVVLGTPEHLSALARTCMHLDTNRP
jgi:Trk K+ transport system NAD-binding subunit